MTMEFRERKTEERAKRIAQRIYEARKSGVPMAFPSMDAVVAPGGGGWQVPEPSADALDHMAAYGFVSEAETPEFREGRTQATATAVPVAASAVPFADAPSLAAMIAAGVEVALARMGMKAPPAPVATNGAPPANEDR